ncbi:endonuclease/exonuclease/phosphatase family protein [Pseudooceanicola nanhaiensis]|uniref:endonuclease/exonuclease/phosphatase family protein n=1 Tax=Pseudooceanicola nanhaiensis TaxID=375761 RepID=UPI001CD71107|nr:endonuclease/exonuclease/phosphatase family protein [Pseudooceanicola nanhaiensis]MCA0921766.1 endonuclease/exonuclease/phosphatase family protein [Pseudooceanicola nanhaiensis]
MSRDRLRIATYNLQKCVGLDLRRRPDRSLAVLGATGAQIAVLQEADKRLPPRPAALPHAMAEAEGWHVADLGEPGGSLGWHGNAILVRDGIEVVETGHIELPGLEPRGAVWIVAQTVLGPVRVIGTHLGLVRRYRLLQLAAIRRTLEHLPKVPVVMAGDFNEWGDEAPLQAQLRDLRLVPAGPNYPAPRPVAALDRFALGPGLRADTPVAHVASPARVASDHLPVWLDVVRDS